MTLYPRSILAFVRAILKRPTRLPRPVTVTERQAIARAVRVCRVEEAANVRIYYGLDQIDLMLWETEPARGKR